ncbi:hypothetical protein [Ruminococcus albus]|uniref:hypothetical protein n=1 Tax=Ruminococcus albus TaxID=1264 RepID=UPI001A9A5A29|nr:hypothetical protein [Ruminococcus albus]
MVYKYLDGYGLCFIAREMNRRWIKSPEYFSHRNASPKIWQAGTLSEAEYDRA